MSIHVLTIGDGITIVMVALLIAGRAMPRKTEKGAEEAARWLAFRRYLQTIEEHADLEVVKDKFEAYLPYAVAFGMERRLISQFAAVDAPAPMWWGPVFVPGYGYPGGHTIGTGTGQAGGPPGPLADAKGGPSLSDMSGSMGTSLASMSAGLGAMLSSAGTVLTSTPPSSSSGGGGGFSGGGFSGGGGGGGGSRGFG